MKRWIFGIVLGILALIVAVPIIVALVLLPARSESGSGLGNDNQVPSDLEAVSVQDRLAVQLTWTPVHQGTATYVLQRTETSGEESWADIAQLDPGASSYLDSAGLQSGVTYRYRIYASDPSGGYGHSNVASAMATALPQPS